MRLLLAHTAENIISLLLFKDGIGNNFFWGVTAFGQVQTQLMEAAGLPPLADSEVRRTAFCPKYMSQMFSRPSGTALFTINSYITMEFPINLANYLREMQHIVIRNGSRTWHTKIFPRRPVVCLSQGLWYDGWLSFGFLLQCCCGDGDDYSGLR